MIPRGRSLQIAADPGFSMGSNGDFMGISWGFHGDFMGFHGDFMGISWGFHGDFLCNGILMWLNGISWGFTFGKLIVCY